MPALDAYHSQVRVALERDGWTITDDPLSLRFGGRQVMIDLGAERLFAAEKKGRRIAVEVKSFGRMAAISEFYSALGQVLAYRSVLQRLQPDRTLYMAIPAIAFETFFSETLPQASIADYKIKLIVFDPKQETIAQWIN